MKKFWLLGLFCFSCVVGVADESVPPKTHPDTTGWQVLFAPDLSNAINPDGVWTVTNGEMTATEDKVIWTKEQYGSCILDLEFKTGPAANSGVFLYCSDLDNWMSKSLEVQILDDDDPKWADVGPTWRCGGIFGRLAPTESAVKKPGEWNRMTITCEGPIITVLLNGEQVTQMDARKWTDAKKNPDGTEIPPWIAGAAAELPTKGHIGLQGKHGGAPIYFRNIKIKPL